MRKVADNRPWSGTRRQAATITGKQVEIEGEIVASTDEPKSTEEGDEMMNDRKGKGEEELVEGDNLKEGNDVEEDGGVGNDVS